MSMALVETVIGDFSTTSINVQTVGVYKSGIFPKFLWLEKSMAKPTVERSKAMTFLEVGLSANGYGNG